MSLIVEDGTGLSTAESYTSVAEADAYHIVRGNEAAWNDLDTDVKEQLLRKATDYLLEQYRGRWKGLRNKSEQSLDWPRTGVVSEQAYEVVNGQFSYPSYTVPSNVVPKEVKNAASILALKAKTETLGPDLDRAVISETVGPLSVTYDRGSPQSKRYVNVDGMLSVYLTGGGNMMKLERA